MQSELFSFQKIVGENCSNNTAYAQKLQVAVEYFYKGDSITCMFHLRRSLFAFIKHFYSEELQIKMPSSILSSLIKNKAFVLKIEDLNKNLPKPLHLTFYVLQSVRVDCNSAVHEEVVFTKNAAEAIFSLCRIFRWYKLTRDIRSGELIDQLLANIDKSLKRGNGESIAFLGLKKLPERFRYMVKLVKFNFTRLAFWINIL